MRLLRPGGPAGATPLRDPPPPASIPASPRGPTPRAPGDGRLPLACKEAAMSRIALLSRTLVCVLTVLGLGLALAPAEARPARQFRVGISPPSGPPGTAVPVTGS